MNYKLIALMLTAILGLGSCGSEHAASQCDGDDGVYSVEEPWTKPARSGQPVSAGYITLCNGGLEDDAIIAVSFEGAEVVEVHQSSTQDGVMQMQKLDRLVLPAGKKTVMEPGGTHLMMISVVEEIKAGESIFLNVEFEKSAPARFALEVRENNNEEQHGHH